MKLAKSQLTRVIGFTLLSTAAGTALALNTFEN